MKGMVFTELLSMAEGAIGEDAVDDILDELPLSNGGAYTAVGNYPCSELVSIVVKISEVSGLPINDLQRAFGGWMMERFAAGYPQFFQDKTCALEMLEAIENEVHVEVRKLYPDAELPSFETERTGQGQLRMTYRSDRPLVAFCHGLIESCVAHFGQKADITVQDRTPDGRSEAAFDVVLTG
ncbi:MAG: heme NO-binding domain-containing protein [Pelagimonas sp.]|jgi:hypothetical protein|nr:heme NO-binding domain-containing protein [Pelagimonas sp.]